METILKETHLSAQVLEAYIEGRLTVSQVACISEHLLECDTCHERYEQELDFPAKYRLASGSLPVVPKPRALPLWPRLFATSGPLLAAAAAVFVAVLFLPRLSFDSSPAVAELTAFRDAGTATAPAKRHLQLRLDISGLPDERELRAEIADTAGSLVWSGQVNGARVSVDRRLPAGQYWVRVYPGRTSELLREYSLRLK